MGPSKFPVGSMIRHKKSLFPVARIIGIIGYPGGAWAMVEWHGPKATEMADYEQKQISVDDINDNWMLTTVAMEVLFNEKRG